MAGASAGLQHEARGLASAETRYNPLARRAAGLKSHQDATCRSSEDDDDDELAAALRAYYSHRRYAHQQAQEFMRQQRVIHDFRCERDARERVAAEMSAIRRNLECEEALRSASSQGSSERLDHAERAAAAMLAGASHGSGTRRCDSWATHEAAWRRFETSPPDVITMANVPWPTAPSQLLHATASAVMNGSTTPMGARDAYRAAFRSLALRWHPDKWTAKWGPRLTDGPSGDAVRCRAREVAQAVTDAWATYTKQLAACA